MNESTTQTTRHFSPCARLAALGAKLRQLDVFGPIREKVRIAQKTVKHTPTDKLYDGLIAMLAGAHGLVEINSRFRADPATVLLGSLAHNVAIWARGWLSEAAPPCQLQAYGIVRMVRDVFHISGFLVFDTLGQLLQIVLNRSAPLASAVVHPLRELLTPEHVAVTLGQT